MKAHFYNIETLEKSPELLPIPLCAIKELVKTETCYDIDAVSWTLQKDNKLVNLTIHFSPPE